jgi:YidC/Oxa1 family membrane protein insertase
MDFITKPLGMILSTIYSFTQSYGLSIVLFTIFIKIILFPLAIKQQKSMSEQQKVQPLVAELQKKYKNDKEKLNQEMMKLYKEHKVNPAAGCLPLIVQLPIIFGLYQVIYRPLTYILKLSTEQIKDLASKFTPQIDLKNEIAIASQSNMINLNFLGLNLANTPQFSNISVLWIIPILAAATTYATSALTTKQSSASSQNESAAQMQSSMMKIFPIMTGFITFQLPAGVGLYWIISNIVQLVQQIFLNKYFGPEKKEVKI